MYPQKHYNVTSVVLTRDVFVDTLGYMARPKKPESDTRGNFLRIRLTIDERRALFEKFLATHPRAEQVAYVRQLLKSTR